MLATSDCRLPTAARTGITLLEVLISMFVLMVGMMGVAALLPAGSAELGEANRNDRASAIGRAAFRDLKVRGWLNPTRPLNLTAYPLSMQWLVVLPGARPADVVVPSPPLVIDPLGVSQQLGTCFPHQADYRRLKPMPRLKDDPEVWIPRVPSPTPANNLAARKQATDAVGIIAEDVFRSQDELTFEPSAKKDRPPVQTFSKANNYSKRLSDGNYSWLATVVPDPNLPMNRLAVSVAVIYKRQLAPEPLPGLPRLERSVDMDFLGGGDIQLSTTIDDATQLNVRRGHWLLIMSALDPGPSDPLGRWTPRYMKWYRVLSGGDPVRPDSSMTVPPSTQWVRQLTVAGPEFPERGALPPGPRIVTKAVLIDGVIAVFEKNLPLEGMAQ